VQTPNCTDANRSLPQCIITGLTLQIPFDITPMLSTLQMAAQPPGDLSVNDNGTESAHFPIAPLMDSIHILTVCDQLNIGPLLPSPCNAIVTHADGTMVSGGSPAKPGETVVLYAYGLGQTAPAVKTGDATPTPAPVILNGPNLGVTVQFDFRPNAGPSIPYLALNGISVASLTPPPSPTPLFVGLTPGQVGLYQINVKIPDTVPSVPPCTGTPGGIGKLGFTSTVLSNLTIDIGGQVSFDGAAICVQPPQ
jgi:hypothetical protein